MSYSYFGCFFFHSVMVPNLRSVINSSVTINTGLCTYSRWNIWQSDGLLTLWTLSSSSSSRAASTDIPDPLSPLLPIVHRLWQVFRATSRILTELLYVCSSWSSCFFSRPYVGVRWSMSLMSSSLILQQCPACQVRLTWIVFVMGVGRWPYSWCFVGCCLQDLFNIARNILVELLCSFFSSHFVSV